MWILPEMDLFASIPDLKDYRGNPLGNSPELFNPGSYLKNILTRHGVIMLGIHIHFINLIQKVLVLQRQRKEHQLTLRSLIQLTSSLRQANRSYPTRMMYSHQSSILWRLKAALSQMSIMLKTLRRGGKEKFGGLREPIMGERGCRCWLRMTMVQFQRKNCTNMHMAQSKCSSTYHSSRLIVMMWRKIWTKTRKLLMGFVVWRCWSKIWDEKI